MTLLNIINLPTKPAVNGIPAKESIATVNAAANKGLRFPNPLSAPNCSETDSRFTTLKAPKAITDANEYAVAYTNMLDADSIPKATIAKSIYPACEILE